MKRSWKMKDAIKMMESNMSPEAVRRPKIDQMKGEMPNEIN